MNEQEANKKAKEMIEARNKIMCPLYGGICQTRCECYKMPEVYQWGEDMHDNNTFAVKYGFCTCYALKGASD